MAPHDAPRFQPREASDWHEWLAANHATSDGVWVVTRRDGEFRSHYEELVREALCWGWIDGQAKRLDAEHGLLWFTRRRPDSVWAASNKARIAELEAAGRLQPAGIAAVERAKANGSWTVLEAAEALLEPDDLRAALDASEPAGPNWDAFPAGVRKMALSSIALAKRPETRARRIAGIVARAAAGERPG